MKISRLFRIIFAEEDIEVTGAHNRGAALYGGLFFVLIALILTIFNLVNQYWFMAATTGIITLGFLAAAFMAYENKTQPARLVIAILCAVIFSYYGISGQNEGFAILWILLVPVIGSLLVGLKVGFLLSLYFQVYLIVIFYTPVSAFVSDVYTATFAARFPLLYFAAFIAITILMCQLQALLTETQRQARFDTMTRLRNRRSYVELSKVADQGDEYANLTIVVLDLNGLKRVNDEFGHEAGDELICGAANCISAGFSGDTCFRTGGDEFMVVSTDENIAERIKTFPKIMGAWKGKKVSNLSLAIGAASRIENPDMTFTQLAALADERMYADKDRYYRENGIDRRRR